jgi:glycosyltransferase involved in cell wall biosynthesis/SAM-dependent methyltransferase
MSSKASVVYALPGKMGGVVTNLANLQRECDRERFSQHTVLTRNRLDLDTPFEGRMGSESQTLFVHTLPLENLHSVLRRFRRAVPPGGGVLVSSDWLELAWVSSYGTERAVFQILHGDFDYYYDLALKHQEVVDIFITCSRFIHEKLTKLIPNRAGQIHHIPYGVPVAEAVRTPAPGPLRLLYAGRLEQGQKRVFDLPRIDRALRERNANVEWTVAGGGPHEVELRSRWEDGCFVRWAGVLSNRETMELMASHDVFVLPSEAEGLPLALLESMSAGLVPVVSDLPSGVRDVVFPGETGFRCPVGDVDAFADAIAGLDADREGLERLSRAGRRIVSEGYDVRQQASRYEDLYAEWRDLRLGKPRGGKLQYGSRLDQPWIPNPVVRFIRSRSRPELSALLENAAAQTSEGRVRTVCVPSEAMKAIAKRFLPPRYLVALRCLRGGYSFPRWGNLRRTSPFSSNFGFERGTSVDRFYLERFLSQHRGLITGRVLEIQGSGYTSRFGLDVTEAHSVDINPSMKPTFVCDLADCGDQIPSDYYDCFLLPNTLQHLRRPIESLREALRVVRRGGVILGSACVLLPLIPDGPQYWHVTPQGLLELSRAVWPGCDVTVASNGNCLVAVAAMLGLAWEELDPRELEVCDPRYPVLVTFLCRRPSLT